MCNFNNIFINVFTTQFINERNMARAISRKTYEKYARKYKISVKGKSMKALQKAIYTHEMRNSKRLFKKKPNKHGDYGLYLIK